MSRPFDFATADLRNRINSRKFPKWQVRIQTIDPKNTRFIRSLGFDILDATKDWPESKIKSRAIGWLILN